MSSVAKKLLSKAAKGRQSVPASKTAKLVQKPLDDESSSDDSDFEDAQELQDGSEDGSDLSEGEEDDSEEEENDVTPEALERMMELLGDVDASELALLEGDEEEDEDEDEDEEMDDGELSGEEELYEDIDEEDGDVIPVERTTVNDKVSLLRGLEGS